METEENDKSNVILMLKDKHLKNSIYLKKRYQAGPYNIQNKN